MRVLERSHGFRSLTVLLLPLLFAGCAAFRSTPTPVELEPQSETPATVEVDPVPAAQVPEAPPADPDAYPEAQGEPVEEPDPAEVQPGEAWTESPLDDLAKVEPPPDTADEPIEELIEQVPTFDIPVVTNNRVKVWLDYYSNRQPTSFEAGLKRSGRYLAMFRRIFAEEGVPQDLVYMAHVESAYKTTAYSRAKARGIFQFMAPTARTYGLKVDYWLDERTDPEKSARASARYMKKLYNDFGDWWLALAAYNAGEGRIRRALRRSGKSDFWGIARTRYIHRETKNHVPAVIAATLISKEPAKYGFDFEPEPPLIYETVQVDGAADLRVVAECAGTDFETLRKLNPALRRQQTPPGATTDVRVPLGAAERTVAALEKIPQKERVLYARHKVRRGDTLYEISRAYGVSVRAVQQANSMGRRTLIRPGQILQIPTSGASNYPATRVASSAERGRVVKHRVRRGDTLYGLAKRYGTSASAIAAASGMSVNDVLSVGKRLTIVQGVRSRSEAVKIAGGGVAADPGDVERLIYTVKRGDTLWRIANRYNTTVDALCAANRISRNATLYPGTRLLIGR